jgi:hypothetical protein
MDAIGEGDRDVCPFASAGRYDINALDEHGRYGRVSLSVR